MAEYLALADLDASINLMALLVWNKLSLPDLSPTYMTLELTDRSISHPVGVAEDVFIKVGTFYFSADFVVIDFDANPRVPLILERSFLKTERDLIDVFEGELTLREYSQEVLGFSDMIASGNLTPYYDPIVSSTSPTLTPFENSDFLHEEVDAFLALKDDPTSPEVDQVYVDTEWDILFLEAFLNDDPYYPLQIKETICLKFERNLKFVKLKPINLQLMSLPRNEAITYNLDQTVRYSANYNQMTANKIDVVELACEEYSQKVLGFSNVADSGTPTPQNDPFVSATSPTLTPFGDSNFLLFEEADVFLSLEDDPNSPKINPFYYDPEGDILLLEAILNSEPSPPSPNQEQNLPSFKEELKVYEAQTIKSSVDEPPEVELKDLPHHLEYAFLEGDNKLPVIIAKELRSEEKAALIKVMKSHKRAIAWKLSDIQGTFQRCMLAIFHDMVEKTMEVFMDDFSVFRNSFENCLPCLDKMLQRCEDTNLSLNWEKSHFMVKEGIVLGHKISKNGIEVDRAKVDVIAKLPHPTT
nr:reverse transcriptase domain-containing protein [Tanacetum cinerariifolium]